MNVQRLTQEIAKLVQANSVRLSQAEEKDISTKAICVGYMKAINDVLDLVQKEIAGPGATSLKPEAM